MKAYQYILSIIIDASQFMSRIVRGSRNMSYLLEFILIKSQTEFKYVNLKWRIKPESTSQNNKFLGQGWVRTNHVHKQKTGHHSLRPRVKPGSRSSTWRHLWSVLDNLSRLIDQGILVHPHDARTESELNKSVGLWTTGEASQGILVYPHDPTFSKWCGGQTKWTKD